MKIAIICAALALCATSASADITYIQSQHGVTFNGCDWDTLVNLKNGYVWECSEYKYTYHYGFMTVLNVNGTSMLCVGDVDSAIEEFPDGKCYKGALYQF